MSDSLAEVVKVANNYKGSWYDSRLSWEINASLWVIYDPKNDLIYPTVYDWDDLLQKAIDDDSYDELSKDEVLGMLFGLHHRNRIIDGLWTSMFERGVTQRLLTQLLAVDV